MFNLTMYRFGHNLSDFRELRKHWRLIPIFPGVNFVVMTLSAYIKAKHCKNEKDYFNKTVLILMMLSHMLFAQDGNIYATVEGDSVTMGINDMVLNCGALFEMNLEVEDSLFTVTAIDTGDLLLCGDCNFDVSITIGNLNAGTYFADIFSINISDYIDDSTYAYDTTYWGNLSFIIENGDDSLEVLSKYQSPCNPISVDSKPIILNYYKLHQNFPNPFNPATTINYSLKKSGHVKIRIFNIKGQLVETLVDLFKTPGTYSISWDPNGLSSGQYYYQIVVDGNPVLAKRAVFLK